jgi:hypothetical protein
VNRTARALLILCLLALAAPGAPARAADPSACALLTAAAPQSAACDAEIAANPAPPVTPATVLDTKLDGVSTPRAILVPEAPLPFGLGWILKDWYYSDTPGAEPADFGTARIVRKATVIYLYATVVVENMEWHLIGKGQWLSGEHIANLRFAARPEGVSGQWIAVDLTEQTLVAFVDDTPVFATLISAAWGGYGTTEEGLFNIYARARNITFRGPPWKLDNPDYVYKFVPNVQFYDGNFALHGAYWHDWFGYARTHGCINIPVADSRWLWEWVSESADRWGPDQGAFHLPQPDKAPFVYVYHSPMGGETRLFE